MAGFLKKRLIASIIALWAVTTLTFFMMHALPGGPFESQKDLPDSIEKNIALKYNLNDPVWKQYTRYLAGLLRGDLGPSFRYEGRSVNEIIRDSFPVSATLGLISLLLALGTGIPAGIIAAVKQGRGPDRAITALTTLGVSIPGFVLATVLIYTFSLKLKILPASLWGSPQQAVLPALALAALPAAYIARLVRSGMVEALGQDYIKTARSKGLGEGQVILGHALKNALIPVTGYLGPMVAGILTGSFVIEEIFAIPGLGKHFVASIANRDYTLIMGVTLFYTLLLLIMNLLTDLAYAWLDPRVRIDGREVREI